MAKKEALFYEKPKISAGSIDEKHRHKTARERLQDVGDAAAGERR